MSCAPATAARGARLERVRERVGRSRGQLGILVQQQAVAAARALHQLRVVLRLPAPAVELDQADAIAVLCLDGRARPVVGGVVEHEHLEVAATADGRRPTSRHPSSSSRPLVFTMQTEISEGSGQGANDNAADADHGRRPSRLHAALRSCALRRARAQRSRRRARHEPFRHGPVPQPDSYTPQRVLLPLRVRQPGRQAGPAPPRHARGSPVAPGAWIGATSCTSSGSRSRSSTWPARVALSTATGADRARPLPRIGSVVAPHA